MGFSGIFLVLLAFSFGLLGSELGSKALRFHDRKGTVRRRLATVSLVTLLVGTWLFAAGELAEASRRIDKTEWLPASVAALAWICGVILGWLRLLSRRRELGLATASFFLACLWLMIHGYWLTGQGLALVFTCLLIVATLGKRYDMRIP